jgi:hypothetical protein
MIYADERIADLSYVSIGYMCCGVQSDNDYEWHCKAIFGAKQAARKAFYRSVDRTPIGLETKQRTENPICQYGQCSAQ